MYRIATARPSDLPRLSGIELAAAALLAGHAPPSVLAETTSHPDLEDARQHGLLWVALADDVPVGFAHVKYSSPPSPISRRSMCIRTTAGADSGRSS